MAMGDPTLTVWSKSIAGMTHRGRNEDGVWSSPSGLVHACIDGMGGVRRMTPDGEIGGEHVTRILIECIEGSLSDMTTRLGVKKATERLRAAIEEGGRRVWKELNLAGETGEDERVAATATVVVICDKGTKAVIAQHGDSRAYRRREGRLEQLTEDQNAVTMLRRMDKIDEEELARLHALLDEHDASGAELDELARRLWEQRHLIFGELGDSDPPADSVVTVADLLPGDLLLICTDGAHGNLGRRGMSEAVARAVELGVDPASAVVYAAAEVALTGGCRATPDDISAIAIGIGPPKK